MLTKWLTKWKRGHYGRRIVEQLNSVMVAPAAPGASGSRRDGNISEQSRVSGLSPLDKDMEQTLEE